MHTYYIMIVVAKFTNTTRHVVTCYGGSWYRRYNIIMYDVTFFVYAEKQCSRVSESRKQLCRGCLMSEYGCMRLQSSCKTGFPGSIPQERGRINIVFAKKH